MARGIPANFRQVCFSSSFIPILMQKQKISTLTLTVSKQLLLQKFVPKTSDFQRFTQRKFSSHSSLYTIAKMENVIAAVQMTSSHDKNENFEKARAFIAEACCKEATVVFLPEGFDYIGRSREETTELAESLDGPLIQKYKNLASEFCVWLFLGGFHEKLETNTNDSEPTVANSHVAIDSQGAIASVYRKVHLFDVSIPDKGVHLFESSIVKAGNEIVDPVNSPVGRVGLGICYDLRFPEFSSKLRRRGSQILTYPSAFTAATGIAHWEVLLRARAIETQCYVVAAAQVGKHNEKRMSYGHSMIIDPWGTIVAHAKSDIEQVICASVDLNKIIGTREGMPVDKHFRHDLYDSDTSFSIPEESEGEILYKFGQYSVKRKLIFLESRFSYAMVNKKCLLPGHVLIVSKRCVPRIGDLSPIEISDLYKLVQQVVKIMDSVHDTESTTITIQDGYNAGQTVPHVHVHALPRRPGDFENNDDLYEQLDTHEKGVIIWRGEEEMTREALEIRIHIRSVYADIL